MGQVHLRSSRLAHADVVGAMGSSSEKSELLRHSWGLERSFANLQEILDSNEVDTVHVCTPNYVHFPQVAALLKAGKNVICEKPLTTTLRESEEIWEISKTSAAKLTVPYVYRFHPMVRELRGRILDGEFGRWLAIDGSYLQDWLWRPADSNWRVDPLKGGPSRVFADIGSHWCDLIEWLTGEQIVELVAESSTVHPLRLGSKLVETEDLVSMMARTANGVQVSASFSQVSAGRKNRLFIELSGERASALFDQEQPEFLEIGSETGFNRVVRNPQTNNTQANPYSMVPAGHPQGYLECFENFVSDSYRYFQGESVEGLPQITDGVRSMKLIDAVVRSSSSRSWVGVG